MNWSIADYRAYMTRRLAQEQRARERMQRQPITEAQFQSYVKDNATSEGLPAVECQSTAGKALVSDAPREATSSTGGAPGFAIRFIVRSRRPCDWDNLAVGIKPLQDVIAKNLGIIPDDRWDILQGSIVSEKAESAEDEGTTVVIEQP